MAFKPALHVRACGHYVSLAFLARSMGLLNSKIMSNIGSKGRRIRAGILNRLTIYREEVLLNLATLSFFLTIHSVAPYLSQYAV